MTQVHVSRARLGHFTEELETAEQGHAVQGRILEQIRAGYSAGAISQQTRLREEMNTLVAEVKYDIAYADAQNAYANLYASMGLDEFGADLTGKEDVKSLAASLANLWRSRETALKYD
jgi:outer membrane protein TolC